VVERSADGGPFIQISVVAYKAPTGSQNEYRFIDKSASGQRMSYRIRQVDANGSYTLSNIVTVHVAPASTTLTLYPNPVQGASIVVLTAAAAQNVRLLVTDAQGRMAVQQTVRVQKGRNVLRAMALQPLPAGTYVLAALVDGTLREVKFIKP
jgi:hypothetical protein